MEGVGLPRVVAITGAGAGVGRATAVEFARHGCDVGVVGRDEARLAQVVQELQRLGVRAVLAVADVADFAAVESAGARIEAELGPIDIWVNNAMATIFGPLSDITPEEFKRATEVTYLGQVYGTMTALKRMRERNAGTIVNVGSALAYRGIPLQSAYCGAKHAARGFTDSLRAELQHDGINVHLSMVHLPAVNTPQFDWALNKLGKRPQPMPPIFQPEVPARAIVYAAFHHRREVWLGLPTVAIIWANRIGPGLLDRYLAKAGYSGQLTNEAKPADAPANLFQPVPGAFGAHGRFDNKAHRTSYQFALDRHPYTLAGTALGLMALCLLAATKRGGRV